MQTELYQDTADTGCRLGENEALAETDSRLRDSQYTHICMYDVNVSFLVCMCVFM